MDGGAGIDGAGVVLGGDVMTGRGVDQVLAHPGPPELRESNVCDARTYVELAERANGPIPAPVPDRWPWGVALDAVPPGAWRVLNLETSVTGSDDWAPAKAVHYRMSPANVGCLREAGAHVWTLANNHVLDFGVEGLVETLDTLRAAGLRTAGAGRDALEAWRPAIVESGARRLLVWSVGHRSSGIPAGWAATASRPGVALLPDLGHRTADGLVGRVRAAARPGDLVVVSVHWGGNWGYDVPAEQRRFAHRLVDGGVHVVHGHSSHHPKPAELYGGGLVLYGCGDLVDDYEGITGYERYRDDLRLLYDVRLDPERGRPVDVRAWPFQARRMRLECATTEDAGWLADTLAARGAALGTRTGLDEDGALRLTAP